MWGLNFAKLGEWSSGVLRALPKKSVESLGHWVSQQSDRGTNVRIRTRLQTLFCELCIRPIDGQMTAFNKRLVDLPSALQFKHFQLSRCQPAISVCPQAVDCLRPPVLNSLRHRPFDCQRPWGLRAGPPSSMFGFPHCHRYQQP